MERNDWYITDAGKQYGPLTEREITHLIAHGRLSPDGLVWRPGLAEWTQAKDVPGLYKPPPLPIASGTIAARAQDTQQPSTPAASASPPIGRDSIRDMESLLASIEKITAQGAASPRQQAAKTGPHGDEEEATALTAMAENSGADGHAAEEAAEATSASAEPEAVKAFAEHLEAERSGAEPGAPVFAAPRRRTWLGGYFRRHAQGQLSMGWSLWFNFVLPLTAMALVFGGLRRTMANPTLELAAMVIIGLAFLPILVWMSVGLWRSAERAKSWYGSWFWPSLVQAAVILTCLLYGVFGTVVVVTGRSGNLTSEILANRDWRFAQRATSDAETDATPGNPEHRSFVVDAMIALGRSVNGMLGNPAGNAPSAAPAGPRQAPRAKPGQESLLAAGARGRKRPDDTAGAEIANEPIATARAPATASEPAAAASSPPVVLASYDKPADVAEETIVLRNISKTPIGDIALTVSYRGADDGEFYRRSLRLRGPIPPGETAAHTFATPEGLRPLAYGRPRAGEGMFTVDVRVVDYKSLAD